MQYGLSTALHSVHTTGAYEERWFEGNTDADYWGTSHRFLIDAPTKFQEFLAVRL